MNANQNLMIILFVWCFLLTGFLVYFFIYLQKIFRGSSGKILKKALESNLKQSNQLRNNIADLEKEIKSLHSEKKDFYQKSAFLRFNPFGDTGGDQSFVWVLLDKNDNGIVLSSLHGRGGTRTYAKKIRAGVAEGHQLSKEEEKVLNTAKLGKK